MRKSTVLLAVLHLCQGTTNAATKKGGRSRRFAAEPGDSSTSHLGSSLQPWPSSSGATRSEGSSVKLMRLSDAVIRELASLHGTGSPRHPEMLNSAFDAAEESMFDAVSQACISLRIGETGGDGPSRAIAISAAVSPCGSAPGV